MAPSISAPLYTAVGELPEGAPDTLPAEALISAEIWGHFAGIKGETVAWKNRRANATRRAAAPRAKLPPRLMPEAQYFGGRPYWTMAQYRRYQADTA